MNFGQRSRNGWERLASFCPPRKLNTVSHIRHTADNLSIWLRESDWVKVCIPIDTKIGWSFRRRSFGLKLTEKLQIRVQLPEVQTSAGKQSIAFIGSVTVCHQPCVTFTEHFQTETELGGQRILTKSRIACRAVIKDWMLQFVVYTSAETISAFSAVSYTHLTLPTILRV